MTAINLELDLILALLAKDTKLILQLSANQQLNWPLFYKLVVRHRICHQAYAGLSDGSEPANSTLTNVEVISTTTGQSSAYRSMLDQLRQFCYQDKLRLLKMAGETVRITREFTQNKLLHCFIKGIPLNIHVYQELTSRPCRDIDLWVTPTDYAKAALLLQKLGYQQKLPTYKLSGFKAAYYFKHKHDIAFYHPQHKVLVELHFRLSYFGIDFFPLSPELIQSVTILNTPVATLKDDYHLLYLMLHAAIHAWNRLRWLNDIALYIQLNNGTLPTCNLKHVHQLAVQLNAQHIFAQALILVTDLLRCAVPKFNEGGYQEITPKRSKYLASIAKQFISADYEVSAGSGVFHRMFFVYRYYLALLAVKGQKFNAICGDLLKIDMLFTYITLPKRLTVLYYLLYPVWVIKYIIAPK